MHDTNIACKDQPPKHSGTLLDWFENYLSGRRQRVVLPGVITDWVYIKAGVPQGSIIGPLLFLIFINDIVNDIGSNIRLFADDISLYIIVDNPQTSADTLNANLERSRLGPRLGWFHLIL